MAAIETVKVVSTKNKKGWRIINKCDMTAEHKLHEEKKVAPKQEEQKADDKKK